MILTTIFVALVILVLVVAAVLVIDKTFTGPAAEFAWFAKIIVGILGLAALVYALNGTGLLHLS